MDPVLDDLNEAQRQAVVHGGGPLMVLAGAGSGKTRVITRRIAHLLRVEARPHEVLALTFTNKAAGEMARRVEQLVAARVHVSTFHSACARFLRRDAERIGFPRDFSIYDTYDRDTCIKKLMQDHGVRSGEVRASQVGRRISQLKNAGITPQDAVFGHGAVDDVASRLYGPYQDYLRRVGAMDFDDLLHRMVELLAEHPDVREDYQRRFRWILVDEFQDTNRVQYELVGKLLGPERNICVVGDPDQSIYRFRGADIRNILDFELDHPDVHVVRLERNYRSTALILRAAQAVIENNLGRKEKSLHTTGPEGCPIDVVRHAGPLQEARAVAERVSGLLADGADADEIAVFYRSHFLSRSLEEGLKARAIPYEIVGGLSFFERREIKDLVAYLRVVVNPLDDLSLERVANVPPRGIGKVTLQRLTVAAADAGLALADAIAVPDVRSKLSKKASSSLAGLAELIAELRVLAPAGAFPVLRELVARTGYLDLFGNDDDIEDLARRENIEELHSDAATFDREIGGGLAGYLQHVSLLTAEDRGNADDPRVSLMTIHAAKGLEFDHVLVVGMEENLFPHVRSVGENDSMEEERRLMYVAMTRARRSLWLSSCETRTVMGRLERQRRSSFLREIPRDCVIESGGREVDRYGDFGDAFEYEVHEDGGPDEFCQDDVGVEPGLRVVHRSYGTGTVVSVQGSGISCRAVVDFDDSGPRTLLLEYAGLRLAAGGGAT